MNEFGIKWPEKIRYEKIRYKRPHLYTYLYMLHRFTYLYRHAHTNTPIKIHWPLHSYTYLYILHRFTYSYRHVHTTTRMHYCTLYAHRDRRAFKITQWHSYKENRWNKDVFRRSIYISCCWNLNFGIFLRMLNWQKILHTRSRCYFNRNFKSLPLQKNIAWHDYI